MKLKLIHDPKTGKLLVKGFTKEEAKKFRTEIRNVVRKEIERALRKGPDTIKDEVLEGIIDESIGFEETSDQGQNGS